MKGIDDFVDILSQWRKKDKNLDVREASSSHLKSSY
jgi:hypothetical protein